MDELNKVVEALLKKKSVIVSTFTQTMNLPVGSSMTNTTSNMTFPFAIRLIGVIVSDQEGAGGGGGIVQRANEYAGRGAMSFPTAYGASSLWTGLVPTGSMKFNFGKPAFVPLDVVLQPNDNIMLYSQWNTRGVLAYICTFLSYWTFIYELINE